MCGKEINEGLPKEKQRIARDQGWVRDSTNLFASYTGGREVLWTNEHVFNDFEVNPKPC